MTIGTIRFLTGDKVDRKIKNRPPQTDHWREGAEFSHYDRHGRPVIMWPSGEAEMIEDPTDLRLDE